MKKRLSRTRSVIESNFRHLREMTGQQSMIFLQLQIKTDTNSIFLFTAAWCVMLVKQNDSQTLGFIRSDSGATPVSCHPHPPPFACRTN